MNKIKLFIENFLIYGMGGIINKIIPLIMLPVVTRLMPDTKYFGLSDMTNTIISLCSALAVMGMYDAMYRMFFEKEDDNYKKDICSTAFLFTSASSLAVFGLMLLFKEQIAQYFLGDSQYNFLVYIGAFAALASAGNSIISAPTRMQNKRKIFLIANTLSPLLSYSISIPLLLNGHYIIALPAAGLLSGIIIETVFGLLNHKWFHLKRFHLGYLKQMLAIAIPLLPNFLIYWVFNSCDKLMITNLLNVGEAGIYSVGSKLGNASQLIYQAFAGGWQYFAFSTMKEDGQVKTNSLVFEYLGVISFGCSVFIFALAHPIYSLLFTGDYVRGYIVSPYLFLAPLLQMLFQVASNQFLVIKKTWPNLFILTSGAIVNLILNLVLIPAIGIEGAAVATLTGYAIADIVAVIVLCRMKLMVISGRFIVSVLITAAYIILSRIIGSQMVLLNLAAAVGCCGFFLLLYKEDMKGLTAKLKGTHQK